VGQRPASEQSGGASLNRLTRQTGGLDATEECVPRLEHTERKIQHSKHGPGVSLLLPDGSVVDDGTEKRWTGRHFSSSLCVDAQMSYQHILVCIYLVPFSRPTLATAVHGNVAAKPTPTQ